MNTRNILLAPNQHLPVSLRVTPPRRVTCDKPAQPNVAWAATYNGVRMGSCTGSSRFIYIWTFRLGFERFLRPPPHAGHVLPCLFQVPSTITIHSSIATRTQAPPTHRQRPRRSYRQSVADFHPVGQALRYKTPGPSFNGLLNIFSAGEINSFTIFGQPVIVINSLDMAKDVLVNRSAIIPIAHDWSWAVNSVAGIVPRCWPLRDLNSKGVNCSSLAESARNACWKNIVPWSTWHGALPATLLLIQRTLLDRPTGTYINKRPIEGLNIYHL